MNSIGRDARKALELARRADSLTGGNSPVVLRTLAAASAAAGYPTTGTKGNFGDRTSGYGIGACSGCRADTRRSRCARRRPRCAAARGDRINTGHKLG